MQSGNWVRHASRFLAGAMRLLALVLCAASASYAQDSAPAGRTIEFSARPRAGAIMRFELRKEQERQMPNQPPQRTSSLLHVTLEVLESGAQGMVVRWSHARPVQAGAEEAPAAPVSDADVIWELVKEIRYELGFDAAGNFVELRNYDEVQPLVDRMLEQLGAIMARRGNAEAAQQATAMVQRLFSSRANLESVLLREPRLFFLPLGKSFSPDAPQKYEAQLPNPFGGPGLPAHGILRLDWVDHNKQLAAFTMEQTLDPGSVRIVLESLFERMPPERRPKDLDMSQIKVEIGDLGKYTVNLDTSFPERMDFARTTRVPGGYRRDAVNIRRLE